MAALKPFALAALLAFVGPARAGTVADWRPFVAEGAARFGVPAAWIARVMQAESGGRTTRDGRPIVSRAGAMGLMQLMPATWDTLRDRLDLGRDPFDPHDNILAGSLYLRMMYDRFGYPGLFAAYNAGPGRYAAFLAGRAILPTETKVYLARVTGHLPIGTIKQVDSAHGNLFAISNSGTAEAIRTSAESAPTDIFAVKH